jgi:hypothetical protein
MKLFELQDAFVKVIIRDTIETYSGQWRLVHEAIQNAHDAIQRNLEIKRGRIDIDLFIGSNKTSIRDNGTGIAIENFANIFMLGGTDKAQLGDELKKMLKGSQGVGIKSTLFTSDVFEVESVYDNYSWKHRIENCYRFQERDFDSQIEQPKPQSSNLPSGSVFVYSLYDYSVQDFLNELASEYCDETAREEIKDETDLKIAVETYFRSKTYLACTHAMLGINTSLKPVEVNVTIHFDFSSLEQHKAMEIERCWFLSDQSFYRKTVSCTFPAKYLDLMEIYQELGQYQQADKVYKDFEDVLRNPPDQTIKKLLIQKFDQESVPRLLDRPRKDRETGELVFEPNESFLKKHRTVLQRINGMYLVIGQRTYLSKYFHIGAKQIISVNGLPTNISLRLPHGALSYLNNVYVVLDVDYTLGFGKRNLHPRHKGAIDAFFVDAWNLLRRIAPLIVGQREGKDPSEFEKWDKETEFDNYRDKDNFLKELPLFFRTVPQEEQEVIALLFELIGRKLLKGYFPFRVGGNRATYDALFYIDLDESDKIPKRIRSRQLRVVEFKYRLSDLIEDFIDERKYLQDIDLLVCWENDYEPDTSPYYVSSMERDGIDNPYPGAQFRIKRGTDVCQVLVLEDFVQSLEFKL